MKQYDINPRYISDSELQQLKENLRELGDLSGIVHDVNSDYIISGNQRSKVFDINDCEIMITEEYDTPTETGTIAHGFVIWNNEKYAYRRVDWTQEQCKKANVTANKLGGNWDWDELANHFSGEELEDWGFTDEEIFNYSEDEFSEDFDLPDGEKEPFQQMAFILADEQADLVKDAIEEAKKSEEFKYVETFDNENSNANALYLIISQWVEQKTYA